MFAIAFDMLISDLKKNYGKSYNNAYFEIRMILRSTGSTTHKEAYICL